MTEREGTTELSAEGAADAILSRYDSAESPTTDTTPTPVAEPESSTEAPAESAQAPSRDESSQPAEGSTTEGTEPGLQAIPPQPPAPAPQPFSYTVDRQPVQVPGAKLVGDEIHIPKDAWQRFVQPNLRDGRAVQQQIQQITQQANAFRQQAEQRGTRGEELWNKLTSLGNDREKLLQFFENYEQEWPKIQAKAEADFYKRQVDEYQRQAQEGSEQEQVTALTGQLEHAADAWSEYYAGQYPGLTKDEIRGLIWDMREALYTQADRDIPEWNVQAGMITLRHDVLQQHLGRINQKLTAGKQTTRAAAQANAAVLGTTPTPPPTVPSRGSPAPGARTENRPKNRAEWEARMRERAGLD